MVGIALFKNRCCFTPSHIDSFTRDIERHVAVDTNAGEEVSNDFTRVGIKNYELCWLAGNDKKSMVGFIKHHRMGRIGLRQSSLGNQLTHILERLHGISNNC